MRATDLLENGFKRYFWKSLFGTSIDGLAIQASSTDGPAHLKDAICGVDKPKPSATRKGSRKAVARAARRSAAPSAPAPIQRACPLSAKEPTRGPI